MNNAQWIPAAVAAAMLSAPALAQSGAETESSFRGDARDAWITGKVETVLLLNTNLNSFKIDTDVQDGVVMLTGTVDNDIVRDLAGELASGVDGVTDVENALEVDENASAASRESASGDDQRDFGTWVDDATTTASVKTRLIANSNIKARQIDVDTKDDVVMLTGQVDSDEVRQLAGEIAMNTDGVAEVRNELVVAPSR